MNRGRYFPYRTTLDKLAEHAGRLQDEGEEIVSFHHVGGRDWVIIVRKASRPTPVGPPVPTRAEINS